MADLKRVYAAPTEEIARAELDSFDREMEREISQNRKIMEGVTGRIFQRISSIRKRSAA